MRRLYHQPLSPFCRKIRLVLAEKKIEVELVEERTWERRMDFLRMNPAGQVPVLRIDDLVLADSTAIFEYLEETHPEPPLLPKSPALRAEARRLTAWFDDKFHNEVTANLVYERVNKKLAKTGYPESEKIKAGTRNIRYHLDYIGWLMDHRRWLAGDMLTIADFAAAAHLSCLDYVSDVDWTRNAGRARVVRQDQVAAGVPLDPRRPGAGVHPAAALCGPRLLRRRRAGRPGPAAEGARGWRRGSPACGICAPDAIPEAAGRLAAFVAAGWHGRMRWMAERMGWRGQPAALWPAARSVDHAGGGLYAGGGSAGGAGAARPGGGQRLCPRAGLSRPGQAAAEAARGAGWWRRPGRRSRSSSTPRR